MKNIFLLLMLVFGYQWSTAQSNPAKTNPEQPTTVTQPIPLNNTNGNVYEAKSQTNFNTQREVKNTKVQPTNAGKTNNGDTNIGKEAAGSAIEPGTGSNRAAGNISSGNTNVSDPTMTNSSVPNNGSNSQAP